ncbi:DMT family transporter [Leptolyngbya sp. FACHB-261]|uniref:DMT family transporter n=1 Tax=Leptolyngbya sp. FACHB-261 TaxID=2692806 RepID=UPI0016886758|nr:EamA family transporter [Leptolyngbya sp. FACHB-261]MBD2101684.1 EamA family transporter [Leptolyngbya sp. FACHB-261]
MFKKEPTKGYAVLALFALAALWGYNWVQMKIAVQYASPFTFAALRMVFGAASLFVPMLWLRKPLLPKEIPGTFLLGLLQSAGVYGLSTWALVSGGAGKTAVLVYTMPFWTLLLAWLILGERVRRAQWIAIALSVSGLILILEPLNPGGTVVSKVLAVLAGASWAGGAIVAKRLRQAVELDLLSLTAWQTLFGALPLILIATFVPSMPIIWSPEFIVALVYNIIPGTAVAMLLWLYILNHLSASSAGLGMLMNPVVGVLAAWVQLGEKPGPMESIGMALIIVALAFNSMLGVLGRRFGHKTAEVQSEPKGQS